MRTGQWATLVGSLAIASGCGGWDTVATGGQSGSAGAPPSSTTGTGGVPRPPDAEASDAAPSDAAATVTLAPPMDLRVVPTPTPHIEDRDGNTVVFHGVNRSGTEYRCVQNDTDIFDGPFDEASVQAITTWKVNAVRVPLNEACWLGLIQNGARAATAGEPYKQAIVTYVALLQKYHLVPILDLHWVGPGTALADRLQPMPDADHAPAFWRDVATTFRNNGGVVFEPFNEPFPDMNRETTAAWQCWRDGCTAMQAVNADAGPMTYQAVGMQALVDAIRGAGASNLVLLGGVEYSNDLLQWADYVPKDPSNNVAAAWHVYNYNACANEMCWMGAPASLMAKFPVVATEIGNNDCLGTFMNMLLPWLDGHAAGYLAWSWNAFGPCRPASGTRRGSPYSLVTDYYDAMPNASAGDASAGDASAPNYALTFHDHVMNLPASP